MRTTRPALALSLTLVAGALALPAAATVPPPLPEPLATLLACPGDDPGTVVARDSTASYDRSTVTTGKRKKAVTRTVGAFDTAFALEGPSCAGASYTITVQSESGSLGWSSRSVSGAPAQTVSPDGSTVTTTWTGDDSTQSFSLSGSTADYPGDCVSSTLTITTPDGAQRFRARLELCDENPGSTSYR